MGRKGASAKAKQAEQVHVDENELDVTGATWLDHLSPEKQLEEKKKMEKRTANAVTAAKRQQHKNEWAEFWKQDEKQVELKEQQRQIRENRKFDKLKAHALVHEHIVEAVDYGDDKLWIQIADKTWKEVTQMFYCLVCYKQLNEGTLKDHIDNENHKRRASTGIICTTPAVYHTEVCYAESSYSCLEKWQERLPDGLVRCVPCGKIIDDAHLNSGDHNRRLKWFLQEGNPETSFPAPSLPYLAYVLSPDHTEHWLKCLLCDKYADDNGSHSGTREDPAGSREHRKNLRNYCIPGDRWYEENVVKVRNKWHPPPPPISPPRPPTPPSEFEC